VPIAATGPVEATGAFAPPIATTGPEPEYRALDGNGRLLAIATLSPQGLLCPRKVLAKG
jgi:hypothetical protein